MFVVMIRYKEREAAIYVQGVGRLIWTFPTTKIFFNISLMWILTRKLTNLLWITRIMILGININMIFPTFFGIFRQCLTFIGIFRIIRPLSVAKKCTFPCYFQCKVHPKLINVCKFVTLLHFSENLQKIYFGLRVGYVKEKYTQILLFVPFSPKKWQPKNTYHIIACPNKKWATLQ